MFKNINEKDKKKLLSLLCLGGICLLSLILVSSLEQTEATSTNLGETSKEVSSNESEYINQNDLEERLKSILSQIKGAGDLDVMITLDSSEEIQPAFNVNSTSEQTKEKDPKGGERTIVTSSENKTMITSSSNNPVIIKTHEPKIKGVIVVSSGADDPLVKETLYKAVQTALQVDGHQVEIFSK